MFLFFISKRVYYRQTWFWVILFTIAMKIVILIILIMKYLTWTTQKAKLIVSSGLQGRDQIVWDPFRYKDPLSKYRHCYYRDNRVVRLSYICNAKSSLVHILSGNVRQRSITWTIVDVWGPLFQEQVSSAWTSSYIPQRKTCVSEYCFWQIRSHMLFILLVENVNIFANVVYASTLPLNSLRPREIDAILQTTFSNAFYWMIIYWFRLEFHWCLLLCVQLAIFRHWFR